MSAILRRFVLATLVIAVAAPAPAQCLDWATPFVNPGTNGSVETTAVFDDGNGPALYVAGSFTEIEGVSAAHIARFDGSTWSALGSGLNAEANVLHVYDDGQGPALYAGGQFDVAGGVPAELVARWRNGTWSALGAGPSFWPEGMTSFDDGSGTKLYVCGSVVVSAHITDGRIQRWNGTSWSSFGGNFAYPVSGQSLGDVITLAVHDGGGGLSLYAAGYFTNAAGVPANGVARWNGSGWSALGAGISPAYVTELASFDDGTGSALYAGGQFSTAGGSPASNIARWKNSAWSALGAGVDGAVKALAVHDDGTGAALHVGGAFANAGGSPAAGVARWGGGAWSALGSGIPAPGQALALESFAQGGVPALFCGGGFASAGGVSAHGIARWSANAWSQVGSSPPAGTAPDGSISALAVHDAGSGRALYAGGNFTHVGQLAVAHVARWDGASWSPLGAGLDNEVYCLARHDDGSGSALYAGGRFLQSGATGTSYIARWDGANWSQPGAGLASYVRALCSFDDGSGTALYAGGYFAGGIARWNGASWTNVGLGFDGAVQALTVFDDGSGAHLHAGGTFALSGSTPVGGIARWDGTSWSAVGPGSSSSGNVFALRAFDDGGGTKLFAGGGFNMIGGTFLSYFARWNGSAWSSPSSAPSGSVSALTAFDDGSGIALYVGGSFTSAGGTVVHGLCRFDGSACTPVGASLDGGGNVGAITNWDSGAAGAADLYVGGTFNSIGSFTTRNLGRWRGCGHPGTVVCPGDGSAGACPCANNGNSGHGCQNSASTGGALLDSSGWNSLGFDTLKLTSANELPNAASIFLQGTLEIGPLAFGDGLRCAGGTLKRLYLKVAAGGVASAPASGDAPISARSMQLGSPILPGTTRVYQVYYRDPSFGFCAAPFGSTFNVSNGLRIGWSE